MQILDVKDLAHAYPPLAISADFKTQPEDFIVREQLGFSPSGEGEHVFIYLRKRQVTTELVSKDIAKQLGLPLRDICYSGLKDKQAVTEQWFSFPWPIKKPLPELQGESWQVVESSRHLKKLRRGVHQANHFTIRLSNLCGDIGELEKRLETIKAKGFANYFGQQRFGVENNNVAKALALFAGEFRCKPFLRSIYYSAARSYLFNHYLSLRVAEGSWQQVIEGDKFNLDGSNAIFGSETCSEELQQRVASFDIHPAGPLIGKQASGLADHAERLWQQVAENNPLLLEGLAKAGLDTGYRPLRACAKSLNWQLDQQQCVLQFELRSGAFATALLRELVAINNE